MSENKFERLDSIDIWDLMFNNLTITDLMCMIEENYGEDIFDDIATDEFMAYLKQRYPKIYLEERIEYYICNKR